jgi:hypothetical protein
MRPRRSRRTRTPRLTMCSSRRWPTRCAGAAGCQGRATRSRFLPLVPTASLPCVARCRVAEWVTPNSPAWASRAVLLTPSLTPPTH